MAFRDASNHDEETLEQMNSWSDAVYREIQDSGALRYEPADLKPLDGEYSTQIGEYLSENFNLDYTAVMFFLDRTKMTYYAGEDIFLASQDITSSGIDDESRGLIAHEQGHRLGRKIINDRLEPLQENQDVSPEGYRKLFSYLKSDNFAERTKVAVGNSLGHDFTYNSNLVDEEPTIFRLKGSLGPDELVDPSRDETVDQLIESIEEALLKISTGQEIEDTSGF